jgi:hypothetical protein
MNWIEMAVRIVCFVSIAGCSGYTTDRLLVESESARPGGKLAIEPARHQLGVLLSVPGKTHVTETRLTNVGRRKLRIHDLLISCDCTHATVSDKELDPGESAILRSELKVGDTLGPRSSSITIRSTDESGVPQSIEFEWVTENVLKSGERSFVFSDLAEGDPYRFEIPLNTSHIAVCGDCRFETGQISNLVKTSWSPNPAAIGLDHVMKTDRSDVDLGIIQVEILPQPEDRHYSTNIVTELTCRSETRARLILPVKWTYDRPVTVAPSSLSVGVQKAGGVVHKDLYVKGSKNRSFRIMSMSSSVAGLISEPALPVDAATDAFVRLTIQVPAKPGPFREVVTIRTDLAEAGEILVPVSGIVED